MNHTFNICKMVQPEESIPSAQPRRFGLRLRDHDYAEDGFYFLTICCSENRMRFGKVSLGAMKANEFGIIAEREWYKLSERFASFRPDVFQLMPNHLHAVFEILPPEQSQSERNLEITDQKSGITVSQMVAAYKSIVSNKCLQICKSRNERMGKLWQRNFYEHVIRDEKSYINITNYIIDNPARWRMG